MAGTIDNGASVNWQKKAADELYGFHILNPRRDDWDATLGDDFTALKAQVDWELDGLTLADVVLMHFVPGSLSPVSMLELGMLLAFEKPLVISCPEGFWRRGNILITAARFNVPVFGALDDAVSHILDNFK